MNKRLITIGLLILAISIISKLFFTVIHNIKPDEFHKAAIIFVLDTSSHNTNMLTNEENYIKSLCAILDPEDSIKVLKSSQTSYLIYEGNPGDYSGLKKAIDQYTKDNSDKTSFGEGIKKAIDYCLTMKKEGYIPAIVVLGSLENNADNDKQINWDVLPQNIKKTKEYIPDLTMMFAYAHPEKLDMVKTKLNPILGEQKLIVANSANADKATRRFLQAIGR